MGPALRRREVCIGISAALITVLGFATVVHLSLLGSMRRDVASVFFQALALSGLLAQAAHDRRFYQSLKSALRARRKLFAPAAERASLVRVVREVLH